MGYTLCCAPNDGRTRTRIYALLTHRNPTCERWTRWTTEQNKTLKHAPKQQLTKNMYGDNKAYQSIVLTRPNLISIYQQVCLVQIHGIPCVIMVNSILCYIATPMADELQTSNSVVTTETTDGVTALCARPSAITAMTKFSEYKCSLYHALLTTKSTNTFVAQQIAIYRRPQGTIKLQALYQKL